MKKILLITLFLTQILFPQVLREFDVKPATNRGQIPIFRDFPDKAAIVFYTQFSNLMFSSSYGIYKELGDPEGGKYIIIVEPTRQTIEVRGSGFKTEQIKINDLQVRDVLYYEILPKDQGITGVTEVGITVQVTPSDAIILLDDKPFPNNVTTKVFLGSHNLRVEKAGYGSNVQEIVVTPEKTLFQINLEKVSLSPVTIKSNPSNGSVYINNELRGTTEVGFFLYSGSYELRIELPDYLPIIETIQVTPTTVKTKNVFSYNLFRNKGILELSVTPSNAIVSLNSEQRKISGSLELNPDVYDLEVRANQYDTYKEQIEIKRGETLKKGVNLTKNTGVLELKIQPTFAVVNINKEQKSGNRFELIPGIYEIEVAAETFYPEIFTVTIEKGKTTERSVTLKQKTGTLQFTIKPLEAKAKLSQIGIEKYSWEGINIIENIPEGIYDLTTKANGYKSCSGKLTISENQTTIEDIQMVVGSDSPEGMVLVEGGTFKMGSSDGESYENPVHQVTVGSFLIGKYEVTQELWESVMGSNPSYFKGKSKPVENVSWEDVVMFCNKLSDREGLQKVYSGSGNNTTGNFTANGYRLPTEAEWEYAARGGNKSKGNKYSGSSKIDGVAWYTNNSGGETHDVGEKSQNELGLYDMSGNVWEWCWDWYGAYNSGRQTNPKGPDAGSLHVFRGGSWYSGAVNCRVAYRDIYFPVIRFGNLGFRIVKSKN